MNLKESFRYQNFLDSLLRCATSSVSNRDHCLTVTKTHLRNKANPEVADVTETVEVEKFFKNDDVLSFMKLLVEEKLLLTQKISEAKASLSGIDLDAAIESNKFRQQVSNAVRTMMKHTPRKTVEQGRDYKFNVEGNQTAYYYDIEVESVEAYDKDSAKELMRNMIATADKNSTLVDAALINTTVDYEPKFDVNDSFEDVMESFIAGLNN